MNELLEKAMSNERKPLLGDVDELAFGCGDIINFRMGAERTIQFYEDLITKGELIPKSEVEAAMKAIGEAISETFDAMSDKLKDRHPKFSPWRERLEQMQREQHKGGGKEYEGESLNNCLGCGKPFKS